MDRRGFLRGLIAAGAAAVAAEFKVSEAMGAEIIEELDKDLRRSVISGPKGEFLGNNVLNPTKMWSSRADLHEFYANEIRRVVPKAKDWAVKSAVRRMQYCIDKDFADMQAAGIPEGKIIVEAPKVRRVGKIEDGRFELIAGSKPGKSFLGTDIITVGYIPDAPEQPRAQRHYTREKVYETARGIVGVDGNALRS